MKALIVWTSMVMIKGVFSILFCSIFIQAGDGVRVKFIESEKCETNNDKSFVFNQCKVGSGGEMNISFTFFVQTSKIIVS